MNITAETHCFRHEAALFLAWGCLYVYAIEPEYGVSCLHELCDTRRVNFCPLPDHFLLKNTIEFQKLELLDCRFPMYIVSMILPRLPSLTLGLSEHVEKFNRIPLHHLFPINRAIEVCTQPPRQTRVMIPC